MKLLILALPLLLGIVIGFLGHDIVASQLAHKTAQTDQKFDSSNNLRVDLNSVFRENIILLTSALRRVYNKEPFAPDATEALNENTDDIGDIIKSYYGPDSKLEFLSRWKKQNIAYLQYTEALRDNDKNKKDQAEKDLNDYVESSLTFWKKLNPGFDTEGYKVMLTYRINFIKNFVNDLNSSNIADSYKEQHSAYQQNGKIADFLTVGIVKQFPEKFK